MSAVSFYVLQREWKITATIQKWLDLHKQIVLFFETFISITWSGVHFWSHNSICEGRRSFIKLVGLEMWDEHEQFHIFHKYFTCVLYLNVEISQSSYCMWCSYIQQFWIIKFTSEYVHHMIDGRHCTKSLQICVKFLCHVAGHARISKPMVVVPHVTRSLWKLIISGHCHCESLHVWIWLLL